MILVTFSLLALLASSNAQYFSAGWSPGQKQPEPQPVASKPVPVPAETVKATPLSLLNLFDTTKILTSGPSVALFNRFGINITERMEIASLAEIWDKRVPLITDDNYDDLIANEALTEQEEIDRVWIIVMYVSIISFLSFFETFCSSVTSQKSDGVSKFLDNVFDSAFNESQITGDLPHVRWGRMDYLNVTRITTKWAVWQCVFNSHKISKYFNLFSFSLHRAPYLVVLKDRGKTLRFYRPRNLRLQEDALREFLKADGWKATSPWSSSYAPGGPK